MSTISLTTTSCPRCQRGGVTISKRHPLCPPCQAALRQEAARQQETDYLTRYLSTRDDDHGREATRLRALAQQLGVDWHHAPASMPRFDARVAALMAPTRRELSEGVPHGAYRWSWMVVSARATNACVPEDP